MKSTIFRCAQSNYTRVTREQVFKRGFKKWKKWNIYAFMLYNMCFTKARSAPWKKIT